MAKSELKMLEEIHGILTNWQSNSLSAEYVRGLNYDPGPDWSGSLGRFIDLRRMIPRPIDPAPEILLDKTKLAELKVNKLNSAISNLSKELETLTIERDLLKQEYKIK